jgi:hypothetical protein
MESELRAFSAVHLAGARAFRVSPNISDNH